MYPKWLYHSEQGAKIVNSSAEQKELGSGWTESFAAANILDVAKAQARANANRPKKEVQPPVEPAKKKPVVSEASKPLEAPVEIKEVEKPKAEAQKRRAKRGGIRS